MPGVRGGTSCFRTCVLHSNFSPIMKAEKTNVRGTDHSDSPRPEKNGNATTMLKMNSLFLQPAGITVPNQEQITTSGAGTILDDQSASSKVCWAPAFLKASLSDPCSVILPHFTSRSKT